MGSPAAGRVGICSAPQRPCALSALSQLSGHGVSRGLDQCVRGIQPTFEISRGSCCSFFFLARAKHGPQETPLVVIPRVRLGTSTLEGSRCLSSWTLDLILAPAYANRHPAPRRLL